MSRRNAKKNIIVWLCVWVILISLSGCGKPDTKADHMLRVGVVTYTPDDPFINAMTDIIKSKTFEIITHNKALITNFQKSPILDVIKLQITKQTTEIIHAQKK